MYHMQQYDGNLCLQFAQLLGRKNTKLLLCPEHNYKAFTMYYKERCLFLLGGQRVIVRIAALLGESL